ncbi:hypothetical protein WKK05_19050 [Nostoc sp. UHCC 0302]|uniref:hypothetical protein n=1 Tax=Nostoc sp. UHCC 0302 TaxID=3134896 RepID=UPI00311CD63F
MDVKKQKCFLEAVHERSPTMDERNHSVFLGEGGKERSPTALAKPVVDIAFLDYFITI